MTTPIVPSITDEQLAEIERFLGFGGSTLKLHTGPLRGLIARLRAAEKDAARYQKLSVVTPYRFRKWQEACTIDGGDVFYFKRERFDELVDQHKVESK